MKKLTVTLLLVFLSACGGNSSNNDGGQQVATVPAPEQEAGYGQPGYQPTGPGVRPGYGCQLQQRRYDNMREYCMALRNDLRIQGCTNATYLATYNSYCQRQGGNGFPGRR